MTTAARPDWNRWSAAALGAAALVGIALTQLQSYRLFHSLAEMFSVVVACSIFVLFWNSRRFLDSGTYLIIGVAYLFVGGLDLIHTLAYRGMRIFEADTDLPTQLWIAARFVEAGSLLAAPCFLRRRLRPDWVLPIYAIVAGLLLAAIFAWDIFPACYVEGAGLTTFKRVSEYVICVMLLAALGLFFRGAAALDRTVFRLLAASIVVTIAAELTFTFYSDPEGPVNMAGHLLKIVSRFLVYKAFVQIGFTQPYALLFRDLKQSEEALRESQSRFEQIAETIHDVFWLTTADKRQILFVSPAYRQIWGRDPAGLYRDPREWLAGIHPDDRARAAEIASLVSEGGFDVEYRVVRPDGTLRWIRDRGYLLRDAAGRPHRVAGIAEDVTEQKLAREAAAAAQVQLLEHQQRQREHVEAELEKVKNQLVRQTRLATIGQVAAGIAHDLRNPLAVVRNAAWILKRYLPPGEPKPQRYLEIIDTEIETTNRIINNLLEAVRAKEPVKQVVDMAQAAAEVFERVPNRGEIDFQVECWPEPFLVHADPVQLRQVLGNLLNNAAEAMGGKGRITLEARREDDFDVLVVRDSGPGIAAEIRETLFEPLVTTRLKGTGLGLAICRQIIERHGGTIDLVEHDAAGAAFRIRLPQAPANAPDAANVASSSGNQA